MTILIAGAGLAGLTAADALRRRGVRVRVIEPRRRLGGRVWTVRDDGVAPFHAEAGGDFIDGSHTALRALVRGLGLSLVRVLRSGFGLAASIDDRIRVQHSQKRTWQGLERALKRDQASFAAAGRDWQSSVAASIARRSLAETLAARGTPREVCAMAVALRGFYLADPASLSTLVAVEQTLGDDDPGAVAMFRIRGGNDRLVEALARRSRAEILLGHAVRKVTESARGVRVAVESAGVVDHIDADYLIVTAPASVLRQWQFEPHLRDTQRRAFDTVSYGQATKVLLTFAERWWRHRSTGFGTNLPIGAVWEAAEEQRGSAMLTLLAGGNASPQLQAILEREDVEGLVSRLRWLGTPKGLRPTAWSVTWEADPWARGGYAVFGPSFDPGLRFELARAHGRVLFAGEHTSRDWQGYMNGAVESGLRVAEELGALARMQPASHG
jgi:monoamine oxidase